MSEIINAKHRAKCEEIYNLKTRTVRLINVQTLGARCGTFANHDDAETHLRDLGYSPKQYWREGQSVLFEGGINC